jgi:cation transport ATPase
MARNLYSVSPGERPVLVREAVQLTEKVVFIDDEINDPFALVVADSEGRAYEIGAPLFMFD